MPPRPPDPDDLPVLRGRQLRYLLVVILDRVGLSMTLPQLDQAVRMAGFRTAGPPGKAASDALRWACEHGHVIRIARGRYMRGTITKQTRYRYKRHVAALRRAATER